MRTVLALLLLGILSACSVSIDRTDPAPDPESQTIPRQVETERYAIHATTVERARESAIFLDYAVERFAHVMGTEPAGRIAVVIFESMGMMERFQPDRLQDEGFLPLPWIPSEVLRESLGAMPSGGIPKHSLAHEACHMFLVGYMTSLTGAPTVAARMGEEHGYGDPLTPDWLDEAVAISCEPPFMRQQRESEFRERLDHLIPLRFFLTMPHPSAGEEGADKPGFQITMRRVDPSERMFYPQALAFTNYLMEREDSMVLGDIVRALVEQNGEPTDFAPLTGPDDDFNSLEEDWLQWVSQWSK